MIPVVLIALAAGGWAAWSLYQFVPVERGVDAARLSRVMATEAREELPFWRALLIPFSALAQKLPISLTDVGKRLYWAQLEGRWLGWSEAEYWGLRLALAVVGFFLGSILGKGNVAIVVGLPFALLFFLDARLKAPANRAIRQVERELPEIAQLLALLVGTGKPVAEALRAVSSGRSLTARWLQRTMAARPPDRPLLADVRGEKGWLREEAERSGHSGLINFAVQLDLLKSSGTGADILLGSLAQSVTAEYLGRLEVQAEQIGDKMVMPMLIFFFVPYLIGLMAPLILGNLGMIR